MIFDLVAGEAVLFGERNNTVAVERAFEAFVNRAAAIGIHPEEMAPTAGSDARMRHAPSSPLHGQPRPKCA